MICCRKARWIVRMVLLAGIRVVCAAGSDESRAASAQNALACAASRETPLRESLASAGLMMNIAEHPKSIRVVAQKLLTEALDSPATKSAKCAGCRAPSTPEIVYRVVPTAFLPSPEQPAMCLGLERATQKHPLAFPSRGFDNVGALNSWINDFSQGRGSDGQQLYAQCGGNCSPRYTFLITPSATGLKVGTQVVCGLARDREVDDYRVSTALRSTCHRRAATVADPAAKR